MREFYEIATVDFSSKEFAYNETADGAEYSRDFLEKCPKCGATLGSLYWLEPRRVVLSKPKYGDFVRGNDFLVSERVKLACEASDLKGIKGFTSVEVAKVRHMGKKSLSPPQYYTMDLAYSFARIDLEKSVIIGVPKERYCELCMPFRVTWHEIRGIYIDDTDWGGEDIFHLHEMGNAVYSTQKFIDFCLANEFTNFKYVNTKDYVFQFGPYT
jgi:hypothetical protein